LYGFELHRLILYYFWPATVQMGDMMRP